MAKSSRTKTSLDTEISNLADYIESLNAEDNSGVSTAPVSTVATTGSNLAVRIDRRRRSIPSRTPSLPSIPSLPRSINNTADKPHDFLKIIEEESDDDEEEFSKVINKTPRNFKAAIPESSSTSKTTTTSTSSYSKVDSYHSDISKISESETLYCKENNINYKKFGRYISLEIDGDGKRIYDMVDIYNHCKPVKEVKAIAEGTGAEGSATEGAKVSLFTKIKNFFK